MTLPTDISTPPSVADMVVVSVGERDRESVVFWGPVHSAHSLREIVAVLMTIDRNWASGR